ncbi:NUDIX hydrolase [Nonomuraea soli]|uniref:8-oxo-dGTP pyrophosphatase MutT (NUDIX family) n=1 Tax=Nonomuraea soli TaxID=1032476 RepID=A0A7W0CU20_9ACTN|nr:NUDIX domain-containing protein [Nonomuraea soli]MBA2897349.1 8-oxo-dGTP pyrophosphatase MutT (NUDIX family) [Nonomuraea soli]
MIPWRRHTARALPVNHEGRVLLLQGFEPKSPDTLRWFTIGGALEGEESMAEAASRELLEETGIKAAPEEFSEPYGTSTIRFAWGDYDITQDQTFLSVYVGDAGVTFDHMEAIEQQTTTTFRWWSADEIRACQEVYHPDDLAELIDEAVRRSAR